MSSRHRIARTLDRLEQQTREWQQSRCHEEKLNVEEERRWKETLDRFSQALPEDLLHRVAEALQDPSCPLWKWVENLFNGRCRVPESINEDVMRRIVLIRLEEADKCWSFEAVCLHCGLQYPVCQPPPITEWKLAPGCSPDERPLRYDLPHFFDRDGCPACGASSRAGEMNWVHLVEDGYWFVR